MKVPKIGVRDLMNIPPNTVLWEATLPGFGARRQGSAVIAFIVQSRTRAGASFKTTIGRYGLWTPDLARAEARRILLEVARGADPVAERRARRTAPTVGELLDLYLSAMSSGRLLTRLRRPKKPSTIAGDRSNIELHIRPDLGAKKVAAVTRRDVEWFMHRVAAASGAGAATALGQFGISISSATLRGLATRGGGPPYVRYGRRVGIRWADLRRWALEEYCRSSGTTAAQHRAA